MHHLASITGSRLAIRVALLTLTWAHTFPARKHLLALFSEPSVGEAWKGGGALVAIAMYLLPFETYVRILGFLWTRGRPFLSLAGFALAAAHLVPAIDHLPRFIAAPSCGDAWRGIGSALATIWFVCPLPAQGRALGGIRRALRVTATRVRAGYPVRA